MSPKGRPAKTPEKKQSESVAVRFTPEEIPHMDWLVRQAESTGGHAPASIALGSYIRSLMLKHAGWDGIGWLPKPDTFSGGKTLPGFLVLGGSVKEVRKTPSMWDSIPPITGDTYDERAVSLVANLKALVDKSGDRPPSIVYRGHLAHMSELYTEISLGTAYGRELVDFASLIFHLDKLKKWSKDSEEPYKSRVCRKSLAHIEGPHRSELSVPTDSQVLKAVLDFVTYRASRLDAIVKPTQGSKVEALALHGIKAMIEKKVQSWPTPEETSWTPCTNGTPECMLLGIHSECNIGHMSPIDEPRMVGETRVCDKHTQGCVGSGDHDCRRVNYPVCNHHTLGCIGFGSEHECTYRHRCNNGTLGCQHGQQKQKHVCSSMLPNHGNGCTCDHCLHAREPKASTAKVTCEHGTQHCYGKGGKHECVIRRCSKGTLGCGTVIPKDHAECWVQPAKHESVSDDKSSTYVPRCVSGTSGCGYKDRGPHECPSCEHGTTGCTGKGEKHACGPLFGEAPRCNLGTPGCQGEGREHYCASKDRPYRRT